MEVVCEQNHVLIHAGVADQEEKVDAPGPPLGAPVVNLEVQDPEASRVCVRGPVQVEVPKKELMVERETCWHNV